MDTGVRRGLGIALAGLLVWGVMALFALAMGGTEPAEVEFVLGLIALAGLLALFGGLARVAWVLLRH